MTKNGIIAAIIAAAGSMGFVSCVKINEELGKEYIPTRHQYDIYTTDFKLTDIDLSISDSLSGYSSSRITIGAVKDDIFGLTTRSSAFPLVPTSNSLDFGENTRFRQFHFSAVRDTLSYPEENQKNIIQNINVYELEEEIGEDALYISSGDMLKKGGRIAKVINYYGQDSLSFDFTEEFGKKYIEKLKTMKLDSVSNYVKELPGIMISVDPQISTGGRINMFELAIKISDSYYVSGNYAELKFTADYGSRKDVDTSFLFFFGAQAMQIYGEAESIYTSAKKTEQYALNTSTREFGFEGKAKDRIYIEGAGGVKPVISSREILDSLKDHFASRGISPEGVIINKATIILPYDMPEDYKDLNLYPYRLSPTCKIDGTNEESGKKYVSYAGLTDSSVESENQGDINKSTNCYMPDVSHHVQEILRRADESNFDNYDIWFLLMANEVTESSSSDNQMSEYYQNLLYYDYYNSLYNPYGYGYGYGYGSYYGGYGYDSYYGMSNYYNYMLAAQYASQSSGKTTSVQLDKDRYYKGILRGPENEGDKVPRMRITYSVARK